jgi:hypothetical protein
VTGEETRRFRQRQDLLVDRSKQRGPVAARQIHPADAGLEDDVPDEGRPGLGDHEEDVSGGMPGRVPNLDFARPACRMAPWLSSIVGSGPDRNQRIRTRLPAEAFHAGSLRVKRHRKRRRRAIGNCASPK